MQITITIEHGAEMGELKIIIETLTRELNDHLKIFEAPSGLNYPYPFPMVTISIDNVRNRQFGSEALALLKNVADNAHGGRTSLTA